MRRHSSSPLWVFGLELAQRRIRGMAVATLGAVVGITVALTAHAAGQFRAELDVESLRESNGALGVDGVIAFSTGADVGQGVSSAGDINGDDLEDFLVSDPLTLEGGEVFVVFGRSGGLGAEFDLDALRASSGGDGTDGFLIRAASSGGELGVSVAPVGDVNADGVDDILLGARFAGGAAPEGEAYLIYGSADGFEAELHLTDLFVENGGDGSRGVVLIGAAVNDLAGRSVAGAGDVNLDGIDDFLVSAILADPPDAGARAGETYLIYGDAEGFAPEVSLGALRPENGGDGTVGTVLRGAAAGDESGNSVSAAGDVNADGVDDLIIGASRASQFAGDAGAAYIVFGREGGLGAALNLGDLRAISGGDGTLGFVVSGTQSGDRWGAAVSAVGDVNADGIDDVMLGAFPNNASAGGVAAVVFGSATGFPADIEVDDLRQANGGDSSVGFITRGVSTDGATAEADILAGGDLNGDGISDVIIGVPDSANRDGQVFVIFGRETRFPPEFFLSS
ncbi:MAG: hypothetical protein AAFX85_07945, partial [Pseudomonadota bacterium]